MKRMKNKIRNRVRSRVEHVFGLQRKQFGKKVIQTVGIARAATIIGMRNLAYNIFQYERLQKAPSP